MTAPTAGRRDQRIAHPGNERQRSRKGGWVFGRIRAPEGRHPAESSKIAAWQRFCVAPLGLAIILLGPHPYGSRPSPRPSRVGYTLVAPTGADYLQSAEIAVAAAWVGASLGFFETQSKSRSSLLVANTAQQATRAHADMKAMAWAALMPRASRPATRLPMGGRPRNAVE